MFYGDDRVRDESKLLKKPACRSIFRPHCEADISELKRISDIIIKKKKISKTDIDLQAALSIF